MIIDYIIRIYNDKIKKPKLRKRKEKKRKRRRGKASLLFEIHKFSNLNTFNSNIFVYKRGNRVEKRLKEGEEINKKKKGMHIFIV